MQSQCRGPRCFLVCAHVQWFLQPSIASEDSGLRSRWPRLIFVHSSCHPQVPSSSKNGSCQAEWQSLSKVWHNVGRNGQSGRFRVSSLSDRSVALAIMGKWVRVCSHATHGTHSRWSPRPFSCLSPILIYYLQNQLIPEVVLTNGSESCLYSNKVTVRTATPTR